MNITLRPLRWVAVALLLAAPTLLSGQQLVYEREYSLFAGGSNRLTMTLEPDGTMTVVRPEMMTDSGRLQGKVAAGEYDRLQAALLSMNVRTADLRADLRQRLRTELFHVSDVETSRFFSFDANRRVEASIEVDSLQPLARRFDDDMRLRAMHDLEQQWWRLMEQVRKETAGQRQ